MVNDGFLYNAFTCIVLYTLLPYVSVYIILFIYYFSILALKNTVSIVDFTLLYYICALYPNAMYLQDASCM